MVVFDSSAFVKLLVPEAGSDAVRAQASSAETVAISWLVVPEVSSALSRRVREGSLAASEGQAARDAFKVALGRFAIAEVNEAIARRGSDLVQRYPIRGADAVHLATALEIRSRGIATSIAVFDKRLIDAARAEGLTVVP